MKKACNKCKEEKGIEEFQYRKDRGTYHHICKKCRNLQSSQWKKINRKYCYEEKRKYRKSEVGKAATRARKKRKKLNPIVRKKYRVQDKAWKSIKNGTLKRMPCEKCGNLKVHAHHPNYNEPLNVMWLCVFHHREWHKHNKAII
jgi:hypothetical protein